MQRIILLGPRGSGKSCVGQLLARRMGVSFLDLDFEIQRRIGMPIADIFANVGDPGFREMEADALKRALASDARVIATGGGVVLRAPSRDRLLRSQALRIFLTADPAVLWHRISADPQTYGTRPALTRLGGESEIRQVLEHRMPFYLQVATHEIDTTLHSPAEVVDEVIRIIGPRRVAN